MSLVTEMEKILAEERRLLRAGDFVGLDGLIEQKSKLVELLSRERSELSRSDCENIASRASHNESLLEAARKGLQAAMVQLKQLSEGESRKYYSKAGERRTLSSGRSSVTKKL